MALAGAIIQGQRYDAGDYFISLGGYVVLGIVTLSHSDSLEPQKVWGIHSQPIGRTHGKADYEGSVGMYKKEADDFVAFLARLPKPGGTQPSGNGYMEVEFPITVTTINGSSKSTTVLKQCRVTKREDSMPTAGGGDAAQTTFQLSVMGISHDNLSNVFYNLR